MAWAVILWLPQSKHVTEGIYSCLFSDLGTSLLVWTKWQPKGRKELPTSGSGMAEKAPWSLMVTFSLLLVSLEPLQYFPIVAKTNLHILQLKKKIWPWYHSMWPTSARNVVFAQSAKKKNGYHFALGVWAFNKQYLYSSYMLPISNGVEVNCNITCCCWNVS